MSFVAAWVGNQAEEGKKYVGEIPAFLLKSCTMLRWEGIEGGGGAKLSCSYSCSKPLNKVEQERNKHYCLASFELGDLHAFL